MLYQPVKIIQYIIKDFKNKVSYTITIILIFFNVVLIDTIFLNSKNVFQWCTKIYNPLFERINSISKILNIQNATKLFGMVKISNRNLKENFQVY